MSAPSPHLPLLMLLVSSIIIGRYGVHGEDSNEDFTRVADDIARYFLFVKDMKSMVNNLTTEVRQLKGKVQEGIDGGRKRDTAIEVLKAIIQERNEMILSRDSKFTELEAEIRALHSTLDEKLGENAKNTSEIMQKVNRSLDLLEGIHNITFYTPSSCAEINEGQTDGVHKIHPKNTNDRVAVKCEMSHGGGWTVIQKRYDGSVDFYREWEAYAGGFGDPSGEHWLGLRHVHALTKAQPMELFVGLTDFTLGPKYARYATFTIASEEDKFRMNIGSFSGNAADNLTPHNGLPFSTKDQDNDRYDDSCSERYKGAWWYSKCHSSNLNGPFSKVQLKTPVSMAWYNRKRKTFESVKTSIMMIRPANFGN